MTLPSREVRLRGTVTSTNPMYVQDATGGIRIEQAAGRKRVGADLPQKHPAEQVPDVGDGGVVVFDDLVDVIDLEDL